MNGDNLEMIVDLIRNDVARPFDSLGTPLLVLASLLRSRENSVKRDALKWVFELVEKIETQEAPMGAALEMKE